MQCTCKHNHNHLANCFDVSELKTNYINSNSRFSSSSLPCWQPCNQIRNNLAIPLFLQKGQRAVEFELNICIFLNLTTRNKFWLPLKLAWSCSHSALFRPLLPAQCPRGVLQVSSCFVWASILCCRAARARVREGGVQPARQTREGEGSVPSALRGSGERSSLHRYLFVQWCLYHLPLGVLKVAQSFPKKGWSRSALTSVCSGSAKQ